ncbi:unnamed protein product [Diatraea saccharalis]|uniref:Uncharacterized protein n=1 Tax=Diatraea saccharalis TaxID=40085 RepID=A0A9N9RGU4_9NEOP|nr:unnamed protein product [Diatraea saccharalis]
MAGTLNSEQQIKKFKKIPIYVVEEHNDALQFIYSAIGGKKLPIEGTTLLHLDAHPDMLIDRKMKGEQARSGRKVLPLLQIENWIMPAVAAGHLGRVLWLHPPWAKQFTDGSRVIQIGDDATTGLLRVDNTEPYYLSDALYSSQLTNIMKFDFTVAELASDTSDQSERTFRDLANDLNICQPYVLDIDLDFFSTANPFLSLYKNIDLYNKLEPVFSSDMPDDISEESLKKAIRKREEQLDELEILFQHLEQYNSLEGYSGHKTDLYYKVSDIASEVLAESERLNEVPDWWAVFAGGCTRDQGGPPHHISSQAEITNEILNGVHPLLKNLPPPVLITVARSTDDGYCPSNQVFSFNIMHYETVLYSLLNIIKIYYIIITLMFLLLRHRRFLCMDLNRENSSAIL